MFGRKNEIKVIKVQNVTRDVIEENEEEFRGYGYASSEKKSKKTTKKVEYCIVLFIQDGTLYTREFNGNWDLKDVKKWEEA